jgi:peptide/nickel transport system substrate-binding protein
MRLRKPAVAMSAVGALVAAACGGSSGGSSTHTDRTPSSTRSDSGTTGTSALGMNAHVEPPAPPIPGARKGGTLTVLSASEVSESSPYHVGSMDPTDAYNPPPYSILTGLVVRSLTQYVYDPDSKEMILVPDLATDLGRPSLDFMTWKFTLRRGVKFENGRPVTAADVKYGIERSFDRKTFPDGAAYSNEYFLHGETYQGPYRSPGPYAGVTVHGRTVAIHMSKPFPDMPYFGTFPAMSAIPPGKASEPVTYKNHPWATGPYMFKPGGYVPNKSLVLVKNPYWDPDTDPGRHQYLEEIDFNFITDSARIDQIMLADTGTGQTTLSYDTVRAADYPKFRSTASDRLVRGSYPCTFWWAPDNRKITDINVRRALAYAYPYQAAWTAAGEIPGVTALPASNLLPLGFPGRVEYNPLPGHIPGTTDPAKAKALLKAAGKMGYPIRFPYLSDDQASVTVRNAIARALTAAGFDPHPVATTQKHYYRDVLDPQATVNVRSGGWCTDWPSGHEFFPATFRSTDIASDGLGSNLAAFSSRVVDDRIDAIPHLLLTEQPPAWNALDELIQTRYFPVIVTGYLGVAAMRGSKVHNDFIDPTFGMPTWKDIWIS